MEKIKHILLGHPIEIFNESGSRGYRHKGKSYIHHTDLHPRHTAFYRFSLKQKMLLFLTAFFLIAAFILNWKLTLTALIGGITFIYFTDLLFNFYLIVRSFTKSPAIDISDDDLANLSDSQLPKYTILCPLYKEGNVLTQFVKGIAELSYPKDKLQVLLLLEEDDKKTIKKARELKLPSYFQLIQVPLSQPKTKPKALNYGLMHANGEYIVVFDAEDIPEPNQLKKAFLAFQRGGSKIKCIQAKLNFYNPHQNTLTKVFTAEYSLWFDLVLTGLQSINAPIPLGGTSNHFRKADIISLKGWDPFNATEDADLGMRIVKGGYRTAIINSETYEEANSEMKNWFFQRTRWIKGYMQTYLVHMRKPNDFSFAHLLTFQLVVGGKVTSMLINPLMWILTIIYFTMRSKYGSTIDSFFPTPIFYMGVFSLVCGNFLYMYYYMIGAAKRRQFGIIKYVLAVPLYWLGMSAAAYIAGFNLLVNPHYWSKTKHGLHIENTPLKVTSSKGLSFFGKIKYFLERYVGQIILFLSVMASTVSIGFSYLNHYILAYGDAESHINISKRVISGLTPGFGQLGGEWLPLPHILMFPFIWNDYLWRTGLAGSFVSAICYVISSIFIYKILRLLTISRIVSLLGATLFMFNPDILYMQSTPLGELPLICAFILSVYYFTKWAARGSIFALLMAAVFAVAGSLMRYDAWFLIVCEIFLIFLVGIVKRFKFSKIEGLTVIFSTLALGGILFWIVWNILIFKDALYFLNSPYSAKSQQLAWLQRGQLPSYHNVKSSLTFYSVAVAENSGKILTVLAVVGLLVVLQQIFANKRERGTYLASLLLLSPFIFYVVTLYLGISIILIPSLVPKNFEWGLFNIRYGIIMVPAVVVLFTLLFSKSNKPGRFILFGLLLLQLGTFVKNGAPVTLKDGTVGLSSRRPSPANNYIRENYDHGFVMFDDFSRSANPVELGIPMNKMIYVGNHPMWDNALIDPSKQITWLVVRHEETDSIWNSVKNNKKFLANFTGVYNNGKTYIYKRNW